MRSGAEHEDGNDNERCNEPDPVAHAVGDLFTQGGADLPAVTEEDILGPSEAFRHGMDYFAHASNTRAVLGKLAATNPTTLACMHGSAWRGDGARLLRALADALGA